MGARFYVLDQRGRVIDRSMDRFVTQVRSSNDTSLFAFLEKWAEPNIGPSSCAAHRIQAQNNDVNERIWPKKCKTLIANMRNAHRLLRWQNSYVRLHRCCLRASLLLELWSQVRIRLSGFPHHSRVSTAILPVLTHVGGKSRIFDATRFSLNLGPDQLLNSFDTNRNCNTTPRLNLD